MYKYTLFYLAYRNIATKVPWYALACITAILSMTAFYLYLILASFQSTIVETNAELGNGYQFFFMLFVVFIFLLSVIATFLIFQAILYGRLKTFAILKTFGVKQLTLAVVLFYEFIVIMGIAGLITLIGVNIFLAQAQNDLSAIIVLPNRFPDIFRTWFIGLGSVLIVTLFSFIALVIPVVFYLRRDPSSVLRSY